MSAPCLKCRHYYVTWDPKLPKGCKLYQFKSKHMPSLEVELASGSECEGFEEKKSKKKDLDLNNDDLW